MPIDESYNEVPHRIAEFKAKHPEGSLQPADLNDPLKVLTIDGKTFVVYTALAFRTPDDPRPGVGVAWEPFPGKTNFTRDSEAQNAETSAWGRAIVAALASTAKKIATFEDVRNREADRDPTQVLPRTFACKVDGCDVEDTGPAMKTHMAEAHGWLAGEAGKMVPPPAEAPVEEARRAPVPPPPPVPSTTEAPAPERMRPTTKARLTAAMKEAGYTKGPQDDMSEAEAQTYLDELMALAKEGGK